VPVLVVLAVACAWLAIRDMGRRPQSGAEGLLGEVGEARTPVTPRGGTVFAAGTHWSALSDRDIAAGQRVRIVGVRGLTLKVEAED